MAHQPAGYSLWNQTCFKCPFQMRINVQFRWVILLCEIKTLFDNQEATIGKLGTPVSWDTGPAMFHCNYGAACQQTPSEQWGYVLTGSSASVKLTMPPAAPPLQAVCVYQATSSTKPLNTIHDIQHAHKSASQVPSSSFAPDGQAAVCLQLPRCRLVCFGFTDRESELRTPSHLGIGQ